MVDGQLPAKVKKDAHDIILEFIRSRPPLKPVSISIYVVKFPKKGYKIKAESLHLNRTQFPSLGIFVSKKVGNRKN